MQWQIGTTWVRDARVRQDAAVVSTAAAEEPARQAQLASDFREQLVKGEAEKKRVMQKLEAVRPTPDPTAPLCRFNVCVRVGGHVERRCGQALT